MNKKYHTVKAFTLLETLASIAIISLVIVGPLSVLSSSSSYARQTKDVIIATYLAEEAIELLQNQYDSIYIYCNKNPTATDPGSLCEPATTPIAETTTGQTAWRVFKERLSSPSAQLSCFKDENADGCTYNATDMIGEITLTPPTRYKAGSGECPRLIKVSKQVITRETGGAGNGDLFVTRSSYVCSGGSISAGGAVADTSKSFSRSISVEHLPTFETAPLKEEQYNDDLRITSEVTFRSINGRSNTLRVTRFMHARL